MKKSKKQGQSTTKLRKKLWTIFSQIVRIEENGQCYTCPIKKPWKEMQAGHYEHKDCMDFIRENIHCQCVHCNKFLSGNRNSYALHLEKDYGYGILQKLRALADTGKNWRVGELLELIEKYRRELKELQ